MEKFESVIKDVLEKLGIEQDDSRIRKLVHHFEFLILFNKTINLTSLSEPHEIAYRLFADSLIPLEYIVSLRKFSKLRILDIGPGGGFPSIPLRIFTPNSISFTLVEKRKKVAFYLEELISVLSLSNIKIVQERIEDLLSNPEYTGKYDLVLNKAALKRDIFLSLVGPFLKKSGKALMWTTLPCIIGAVPSGWVVEKEIFSSKDVMKNFPGVIWVFSVKG